MPDILVLCSLVVIYLSLCRAEASSYTAVPRWGQATALLDDILFVQGGKTDIYNQYSYTSAPNNNNLLSLDLSMSFDAESPPWNLLSSTSSSSTAGDGPSVSWHTLSAFSNTELLIFGGDPGQNTEIAINTRPDSAYLLDVANVLNPGFVDESESWANEPIRRIYHAAASIGGKVYIIGGMKDDGSETALSDNYIFDPSIPEFTNLTATNGPPDVYGHRALILNDGRLVVFGGYSQSRGELLPMNYIWVLDPSQNSPSWSLLSISTSSLPSGRRDFAATVVEGGQILIHGGADATLENVYDDAWILDTSANPMTWSSISSISSSLGYRYDHFAVAYGSEVIFGFGYGKSGPAPAGLSIFQCADNGCGSGAGTFQPSYTPPSTLPTATTLVTSTQTPGSGSGSSTDGDGSGATTTKGPSGAHSTSGTKTSESSATASSGLLASTGTRSGARPTSSTTPNGSGNGGTGSNPSSKAHITAIAIGTTLGALGLILVLLALSIFFSRGRRSWLARDRFHRLLDADDDDGFDGSPYGPGVPPKGIPIVGGDYLDHTDRRWPRWAQFGTVGSTGAAATSMGTRPRRDMLADEDTREFGLPGSMFGVRRDGSGGSSWSLRSMRDLFTGKSRSREASGASGMGSAPSTPWLEKANPFMSGPTFARRPSANRETSYASTLPYVDPWEEEDLSIGARDGHGRDDDEDRQSSDSAEDVGETSHLRPRYPALQTLLPLSTNVHTLSPVAERNSQTTLNTSSNSHSHSNSSQQSHVLSPFSTFGSSYTSHQPDQATSPGSPRSRPSSIIGASAPTQPIRRSDSWWDRFAHTTWLERRRSRGGSSSNYGIFDIRDPNPPPRLDAIKESIHTTSPESPSGSRKARKNSAKSSIRTADSEMIERLGGDVDVVQREGTGGSRSSKMSHATRQSRLSNGSTGGMSVNAGEELDRATTVNSSIAAHGSHSTDVSRANTISTSSRRSSFAVGVDGHAHQEEPLPPPTRYRPLPAPPTAGKIANDASNVKSRVHEYEHGMSLHNPISPLSPRNTRKTEQQPSKGRVSVNYGLVQRPSLFVANPDHSAGPSSDS